MAPAPVYETSGVRYVDKPYAYDQDHDLAYSPRIAFWRLLGHAPARQHRKGSRRGHMGLSPFVGKTLHGKRPDSCEGVPLLDFELFPRQSGLVITSAQTLCEASVTLFGSHKPCHTLCELGGLLRNPLITHGVRDRLRGVEVYDVSI